MSSIRIFQIDLYWDQDPDEITPFFSTTVEVTPNMLNDPGGGGPRNAAVEEAIFKMINEHFTVDIKEIDL